VDAEAFKDNRTLHGREVELALVGEALTIEAKHNSTTA
jgi:hypothetical protein